MADLEAFFNPRSICIIGASRHKGKIGNSVLRNIINAGFHGDIYPINPKSREIAGKKCYPSVLDVNRPIDLAVITVPAETVIEVAGECGRAGVKFLIVITAGFKEIGPEGLEREKKLKKLCRKYSMRLLGPNCVGFIDMHRSLNATFSAVTPLKGNIVFISQSGAMLVSILDWSKSLGLGFSHFISLGNKADLDEADFIEQVAEDPHTKAILCYLEDVAEGRRFLEVSSKASLKKPVVIFKSGISQAGAKAASSHTGALAGSDRAYDAAFKQCGVIRVETMSELFDLAIAFSGKTLTQGRGVAIITNSGGPGIVAADCVEAKGLKMVRFSKKTISKLRTNLPAEASLYNPVDVLGDARKDRFEFSLRTILADESVNNVLVLITPLDVTEPVETAKAIVNIANDSSKPVFVCFLGGEQVKEGARILTRNSIPCYSFPEPAVNAILKVAAYTELRNKIDRKQVIKSFKVDAKTVKAVFFDAVREHRLTLLGNEAAAVAEAYGIPVAPVELARTAREAEQISSRLGFPVVLKVSSPKIIHKSDIHGVRLNLKSAEEVRKAFRDILDSAGYYLPEAPIYGVEVQPMVPEGTELIIGMNRDVQFGPLLAFGLGGIYVNLLKDVSFRLAEKLDEEEIRDMIKETRAYSLLRGYRGEKPRDMDKIIKIIARFAKLANDFPEILDMEINPLIAYEKGAAALDIKMNISELCKGGV